MHLCLFEDSHSCHFLPLTYFRPIYDLRCGMFSLAERSIRYLHPESVSLHCRSSLAPLVAADHPDARINTVNADAVVFVNGRCVMNEQLARTLRKARKDTVFVANGEIVAARLTHDSIRWAQEEMSGDIVDFTTLIVSRTEVKDTLVRHPWDLVYWNEITLESDFELGCRDAGRKRGKVKVHRSAILVAKSRIHIGKGAEIGPGVIVDASEGPVWIGNRTHIQPGAVIKGPCHVGNHCVIKIGAKIHGNTSIGDMCKVGGEVDHAILHSHVNKQHDGFLGHSYLSPWVNLGAGTTTSNLKNTYGNVRIQRGAERVDSGRTFLGLIAGDHVKTGINVSLDTGTIVGPSSNIIGPAIPPKFIPAFSWSDVSGLKIYEIEKALEVARRVMQRRNVEMSATYAGAFRRIFQMTKNERANFRG